MPKPSPWRKSPIWRRWRWELAYWLNRMSRRWCWASLCSWAVDRSPLRELPEARDVSRCVPGSPDTQRCGHCYCGKFRETDHA